jgi:hypothetical protein
LKRLADQTLYEILEVRDDAAAAEIRCACERAMALYGPGSLATYSLMSTEEASLLTRRIEEAQTTLLDPDARARYDEELQRPPSATRSATGSNGAGAPLLEPPPVIPAMQLPPLRADDEDDCADEPEPSRTPIPLPPVPVPVPEAPAQEEAPRAVPIPLSREVPPAAAERPALTPPPLPSRPPAPPAPVVPEGAPWSGEVLRQVREARGVSVQQIAERTKVTRHHIENIEADRFGALPASVYLRGILLAMARELRLDGQKVARSYLERVVASGAKPR